MTGSASPSPAQLRPVPPLGLRQQLKPREHVRQGALVTERPVTTALEAVIDGQAVNAQGGVDHARVVQLVRTRDEQIVWDCVLQMRDVSLLTGLPWCFGSVSASV